MSTNPHPMTRKYERKGVASAVQAPLSTQTSTKAGPWQSLSPSHRLGASYLIGCASVKTHLPAWRKTTLLPPAAGIAPCRRLRRARCDTGWRLRPRHLNGSDNSGHLFVTWIALNLNLHDRTLFRNLQALPFGIGRQHVSGRSQRLAPRSRRTAC